MPGPNPTRRPSIRKIAAEVGLSPMAVSLALRDAPGISAATRQRVRAKAAEMGYYPDPELVHLSTLMRTGRPPGFHSTLAFLNVFPERDRSRWEAYLHGLFEGAKARAERIGYRLEEFWTREPGLSARRLSSILFTRGIKGVLLPVLHEDMAVPDLDWSRFTVVTLTDSPTIHGMLRVAPDNAYAMNLGLSEIARLGYTRPALLVPAALDERTRRMQSSVFARWIWENRLGHELLELRDLSRREFVAWLEACRPDVVFCPHADPFGAWWRAWAATKEEPPAFVSLAWSSWLASFAGMDKCTANIGGHGVDMLVAALNRGETGLKPDAPTLHVPGLWRDGPSCPPAAERRARLHGS